MPRIRSLALAAAALSLLAGPVDRPGAASSVVVLATTTSTQDSGLLDALVPVFEQQSGYTVKTVAVGTGQALVMGDRGEADVVLVHAPALEQQYVAKGTLTNRRLVMHNDFVIVGPADDPAGVKNARGATEALARVMASRSTFVSRGDNSGTHAKEKALWKAAGIEPAAPWYIESGQGMGATLTIASEKHAYTLTDRATYLALRKRLALEVVLQRDPSLLNVYHVLEVDPARHPRVNAVGGKAFADFIVSPAAQTLITTFGVDTHGEPLFFPDAGKPEPSAR